MPGEAHDRRDYAAGYRCGHSVAGCARSGTPRLSEWVPRRIVVAAFDQQPGLLLALADPGQGITAAQLIAVQANGQVASAKAGGHLMIGLVGVRALVPDDHAGGGILDVDVVHRLVFGATRHPSDLRIHRRTLGNGPRHQHTVDLETEVVIPAARRVILDDETWPALACCASSRLLGTSPRPPLSPVIAQTHAGYIPARPRPRNCRLAVAAAKVRRASARCGGGRA